MEIIQADERHIPAIQNIYAHHVLHGTATFETVPPDNHALLARMTSLANQGLPWFVLVDEGRVRGYCYLGFYRARTAYRFTVEDSIYISPDFLGRGAGKKLLAHAVSWAEAHGFRQMVAIAGGADNRASLALHQSAGFAVTGTLHNVGFKHGRWLNTTILQRSLGSGAETFPEA